MFYLNLQVSLVSVEMFFFAGRLPLLILDNPDLIIFLVKWLESISSPCPVTNGELQRWICTT